MVGVVVGDRVTEGGTVGVCTATGIGTDTLEGAQVGLVSSALCSVKRFISEPSMLIT